LPVRASRRPWGVSATAQTGAQAEGVSNARPSMSTSMGLASIANKPSSAEFTKEMTQRFSCIRTATADDGPDATRKAAAWPPNTGACASGPTAQVKGPVGA